MPLSRAREVRPGTAGEGPVIYWMGRDQRCADNHALWYAQQEAVRMRRPLEVAFALSPSFLGATLRQYGFMLRSLKGVQEDLAELDVPFHLLPGGPHALLSFLSGRSPAMVVEDFDPLRIRRDWKALVRGSTSCPHVEVDAHNIVPCWVASPKQEWAARTLRPRLARLLDHYLGDMPAVERHPFPGKEGSEWTVRDVLGDLDIDRSVRETGILPGRPAAERRLHAFIRHRLENYPEDRNDPLRNGPSGLSPYLHYGTLSAQRVALEVLGSDASKEAQGAFLEELIVRRELSDNFCYYNPLYDSYDGLPEWSRRTLEKHAGDRREHQYSMEELEGGETGDDLWNAMQVELTSHGRMHGYLRMYWAKKVLEWSPSPRLAIERLVRLNDRYQLDGRDPNGYVGILWSVGGLHDRPWKEREVYGTVRYMSRAGLARKFDAEAYRRRNLEVWDGQEGEQGESRTS